MLNRYAAWADLGTCRSFLIEAFSTNTAEGHDSDSFAIFLIGLVEDEPAASAEVLNTLLEQGDTQMRQLAFWLLEFCT